MTAPVLGTAASYGTDVMGRLTSRRTAGSVIETTVFDAAHNPTVGQSDTPAPGWRYDGVRLIDDGRSRYRYDPAGRLIQTVTKRLGRKPDVWHYHWDAWDRLRTVTTPDGQQFSYTYDPAGRRLSKSSEHTQILFAWNGTQLVEQTSTEETTSWSYLPGRFTPHTQTHTAATGSETGTLRAGELSLNTPAIGLEASQNDVDRQFYALITDHIDTPVALLDPTTGTLAGEAHTTMWGQTTWTGTVTPWRYPGQYHDPETGLHYNHHRYYQPGTGRYLTPDPLGLAPAPNPYGYVGNPSVLVDPLGLAPCPPRQSNTRGVYDVMAEANLPEHMYEASDGRHFQEASRQLYHAMRNDPALMSSVEARYPGTFDHVTPRRLGDDGIPLGPVSRQAPPGLTWHHHETVRGLLRLVDQIDHAVRHGDYHPTGRGGRAVWGGGSSAR